MQRYLDLWKQFGEGRSGYLVRFSRVLIEADALGLISLVLTEFPHTLRAIRRELLFQNDFQYIPRLSQLSIS